jgi:2-amino-4-hydroxy-6-hydroxymethyldihydropteridine diphosphokinase
MSSTVAIALGSNLGDRALMLRRAVDELRHIVHIVRVSSFLETEPVDALPGSPRFLNAVVIAHTSLTPPQLLEAMQTIESRLGRRRTGVRNAPRTIDLDLIFHSAHRVRSPRLTLPHPRYREREFVMKPLAEVWRYRVPTPPPSSTC